MYNLSAKRHYLTNSLTGFKNFFNTIITSVESYNDPETLYIYLYVNPTNEQYTDVQRIETIVTYNLIKDTYTIKLEGKGSRKYNRQVKYDVAGIIDHLVKEATDTYKGDTSEARSLTVDFYCTQLKEAGATTAQSNQMYYDINHTYNTVQEAYEAFNTLMNELTVNEEVAPTIEVSAPISNEIIETIVSTIEDSSNSLDLQFFSTEETKQPETYHLYKNTFNTYNEAYDHALQYSIPTTMIISSLHPTLTNERLQHLEHELTFSKSKMSHTDMKEYFTYIDSLQSSYDTDERYYKLKSFIQRYEYKQQSKLAAENEQQRLSIEGSRLMVFMKEHGLQLSIKESTQWYYYKGVHVYSFHHCSVEQYHNDMLNLFNEYFPEYTDEYNNTSIHYYKGNEYTTLSMDHYPIGWISYNNNTQIAVFNRLLTSEELAQYNLIETVQQTA